CATAWPPLLANGTPTGGTGVTASKLGTITRSGGSRQVTYNGHPVYLYAGDKKPGDVNGQGVTAFGAARYAVSPTGRQITRQLTGSPAGTPAATNRRRAMSPGPLHPLREEALRKRHADQLSNVHSAT